MFIKEEAMVEVNVINLLLQTLGENPKAAKKITRAYKKEKGEDNKDITDQARFLIAEKTEQELLSLFGDCFAPIVQKVKTGIRFQQAYADTKSPVSEVIPSFVLYKFFELLLNKWKEPDTYEKELFALIYHNVNKTKLKDFERTVFFKETSNIPCLSSLLCGSEELYAYIHELLLHGNTSIEEIDKLKFTKKELDDVAYEMAVMFDVNYNHPGTHRLKGRLSFDLTSFEECPEQSLYLIVVGCMCKVITKLMSQVKALSSTAPQKEVIIKEDTESKKLAQKKQEQLNKLQLQYDKQQAKLETVTADYNSLKDYVSFLEQAQNFVEKKQEENPLAKPVIPWDKKNTILFGGHPNFQAKFVERYPWVRVISPDDKFDINIVKNADLVLINWRHLSHSQFYAFMPVIREYKKEYVYVW